MNQVIRSHFQKTDPTLFGVLKTMGDLETIPSVHTDHFVSLCREIIAQQLATKAAQSIFIRFSSLYPKGAVTPVYTLSLTDETLRNVGLSWAKVKYIKDLATKITAREIDLETLKTLDNETVITTLTKVKGIGRWTAEMFLIFALEREDVFSYGDLGLRRAIEKLYKKKAVTNKQIAILEKKWAPFKSYACRVLWKSLEK